MPLGKKLKRNLKKIGKKTDGAVHKLGHKVKGGVARAEKINQRVIAKSGGAIHKAARGVAVADKILRAANQAGLSEVPLEGSASVLAARGAHQASKGLKKVDKLHNKYTKKSGKVLAKASRAGSALEKHNTRKELAKIAREDDGMTNFV